MTPDKIRAIAPELAGETDETLSTFIDLAAERMTPSAWGSVYGTAVAYLAAHLRTVALRDHAGAVSSVSVGRWSVSYSTEPGPLGATRFGQEYLALMRTRAAGRSRLIRPRGSY